MKLDNIIRLRACYWTAKTDDSVIYRIRDEVVDSNRLLEMEFDENSLRGILDKYQWYPEAMKKEYGHCREWDRNTPPPIKEEELGRKWYKHMTNNVATTHWAKTSTPLLPSSYIDCAIDTDQHCFLNPTMRDVILSSLEQDTFGDNAKKKRARRRMDFLDGNAKSYAKWLNSPARMEKYSDQNSLAGMLANMRLEKDNEKKRQKEKQAANAKERKRKNAEKAEQKRLEKETEEPIATSHVNKGMNHVLSLNVPSLCKVLMYHYGVNEKAVKKMRRPELVAFIEDKMQA